MADASHYSQGHAASVLRSQTWRTAENSAGYLLPHLRAGQSLLDVGCGTGTITLDLAARVAPGPVLGVDAEPALIDQARADARARRLSNVTFVVADAADVSSAMAPEGVGFDVVHSHAVLLHVGDPVAVLRAMLSAAHPGGLVAARETDYAAMAWWPADPRLDRWLALYRDVAHDHRTEPDAGRRLLGWARAAGAHQVDPSASVWLHATPDERARWGGMWADRILDSAIADHALSSGLATRQVLEDISAAWRAWAADPDGWWLVPHGEILCRT